jgi:hypothetical protein
MAEAAVVVNDGSVQEDSAWKQGHADRAVLQATLPPPFSSHLCGAD